MKKTGFTLAEVLITLTIIGVVATMTLPALMTNVQEQQAKTGLKKGLNTLTEAAQLSQAIDGFDYAGIKTASSTDSSPEAQSLAGLLKARTQYDARKSVDKDQTTYTEAAKAVDSKAGSGNYVIFFRDGSAVSFAASQVVTNTNIAIQADGLPLGFGVVYDINGEKKPNLMSNCGKEVAKSAGDAYNDKGDTTACTKATRVIRDQFALRLRGGFAQPIGRAAKWAASN